MMKILLQNVQNVQLRIMHHRTPWFTNCCCYNAAAPTTSRASATKFGPSVSILRPYQLRKGNKNC